MPSHATRARFRAAGAGVREAGTAAAGAGAGAIAAASSGRGALWIQVIGGVLILALIYLLVAGKGAAVFGKLIETASRAVNAFIAPVDPIAGLESAFGATPIAEASEGAGGGASGNSNSPPAPAANASGYVQPFKPSSVGRVDQGQDFTLPVGAPIRAVGSGKITALISNWYRGQPLIAEQLSTGPEKGKTVYVAEQVTPTVHVGQRVTAGQVIGHYSSTGTGIEYGWAKPSGETLAQSTTGYTEGQATPAGQSIRSFLHALGVD